MTPPKVRRANKASATQLALSIPSSDTRSDGSEYGYTVATSSDLNNEERGVIWDMFQSNMHHLYINSVFGWDPASKQQELFDPLSRFILVHQLSRHLEDDHSKRLVAYTMFRFDLEEGEEVIYCYELQVSKEVQQRGLGKTLMQSLVDIGGKWGMRKVMLTVLKRNTAAIRFYQSAGFEVDSISPEYQSDDDDDWVDDDDEEYDYQILSKHIAPSGV